MTTVAIIGGGLGGLAAGCLLQASGARCTLFEQRPALGGLATTLLAPQVSIDGGVSWVAGYAGASPAKGLFARLGLMESDLLVTEPLLTRIFDGATGRRVDVTRDLDRLGTDLVALAPEDGADVAELIEGARAFAASDGAGLGLSQAPELEGVVGRFTASLRGRALRRWTESPRWSLPPDAAWEGRVGSAVIRDLARVVGGPGAPTWRAMAALGHHAAGGTARVRGGGAALVAALAERFTSLGGVIAQGLRVTRVDLEGDRARGIVLANGAPVPADAVVCTTDPWQTHGALLGGHDIDESAATRIALGAVAWPSAYVHVVVEGEIPEAPWRAHLLLHEPWTVGDHATRDVALRYLAPGEGGTPAGHTTAQAALETTWEWWCDDDPKSDAILDVRRTALVTACISQLNALHPGIARRVRRTEAITPDLFHRATGAHQGVTAAWLATPDALRHPLPVRVPGLRNVYAAGQWNATGPGVLGALHAARRAAQLACHDAGIRFDAW